MSDGGVAQRPAKPVSGCARRCRRGPMQTSITSRRTNCIVIAGDDLLGFDRSAAQLGDAGSDLQHVVEPAPAPCNRRCSAGPRRRRRFASRIACWLDAERPQHLGAGPLGELQVIGVIDDAGRIGVLVIDPHGEVCAPPWRQPCATAFQQRVRHPGQQVELAGRVGRRLDAEMAPAAVGQHAAARRALKQPCLHQIGLDHVLDRVALLGQRRGHGLDADRPAAVIARRCSADSGGPWHRGRAPSTSSRVSAASAAARSMRWRARHRGEVAHAAQQAPATRGVPRARRAISDAPSGVRSTPSMRAPRAHDQLQLVGRVEHQPQRDAEALAQRRGDQARRGWSRRPG